MSYNLVQAIYILVFDTHVYTIDSHQHSPRMQCAPAPVSSGFCAAKPFFFQGLFWRTMKGNTQLMNSSIICAYRHTAMKKLYSLLSGKHER